MAAQPTLFDVARRAGVSKSTVSRVLNDPDGAPSATRTRVQRACADLDYRPSRAARALRVGRSEMIALLVGDVSQPYHAAVAKGLQRAAQRHGYSVMLLDLERNLDRLAECLDQVAAGSVFGTVIATTNDIDTPVIRDRVDRLTAQGIAVVTTAQSLRYSPVPAVRVDHADTAYRATRHLLDGGCHDVALVAGDPTTPFARPMVRGYLDALPQEQRERASTDRVLAGSFEPGTTAKAVADLLGRARPDGFVAASVFSVLGIQAALREADLDGAATIVCCEDVPLLDHLSPPVDSFGIDYDPYAALIVAALEAGADAATTEHVVKSRLRRRGDVR